MLYTLCYLCEPVHALSYEELEGMRKDFGDKSEATGVTGLQVFDGEKLSHFVEGEEEQVLAFFADMQADDRFKSVTLVSQRFISGRSFHGWLVARRPAIRQRLQRRGTDLG